MPAILSRLSILFINYKLRVLENIKILLYKLFVQYLVVKPVCVNAATLKEMYGQNASLRIAQSAQIVFFMK